jgi:lycopene beta-cyclase
MQKLAFVVVLALSSCCQNSSSFSINYYYTNTNSGSRFQSSYASNNDKNIVTRTNLVPVVRYSHQRVRQEKLKSSTLRKRQSRTGLYNSVSSLPSYDEVCDVLVLGSGPAACAISSLVSSSLLSQNEKNVRVVLADTNIDKEWVPNYGVWKDEWEAVVQKFKQQSNVLIQGGRVGIAIDREWLKTDCFFGGSHGIETTERLRIDRPYYRVDKNALQQSLASKQNMYDLLYAKHISTAITPNVFSPANTLVHDESGTTIQLQKNDGSIITVRTKFLVDCTGHESKLIMKDSTSNVQNVPKPGYQIAYGAIVDVDETNVIDTTKCGPYDKEAMTLFDYRTDHYDTESDNEQRKLYTAPTFMYVMPLQDNQIFIEETSLVARPAISFQECKDRCYKRMEYLGISVSKIHEEEYCYIPMGGGLPIKNQRIIAVGGSASMVHPATGYHICRCLMGAADVSQVIVNALKSNEEIINIDSVVASAYNALWTPDNIRQRNFAVFGGEFLMKQNVVGLRGFFDGFFRLPQSLWSGFLAGWPGLPNNIHHESWYGRLWYGLNFIIKLPPSVAIELTTSIIGDIVTNGVPLPQSVTPFLGEPESYEYRRNYDRIGDVAAKNEARQMIIDAKLTKDIPVDFVTTISSTTDIKSATVTLTQEAQGSLNIPTMTRAEVETASTGSFQ